jgi:hypothetical protein
LNLQLSSLSDASKPPGRAYITVRDTDLRECDGGEVSSPTSSTFMGRWQDHFDCFRQFRNTKKRYKTSAFRVVGVLFLVSAKRQPARCFPRLAQRNSGASKGRRTTPGSLVRRARIAQHGSAFSQFLAGALRARMSGRLQQRTMHVQAPLWVLRLQACSLGVCV